MRNGEFWVHIEYLYRRLVGSEKACGVDRIYLAGGIAQLTQKEKEETSIPFVEAEIKTLND